MLLFSSYEREGEFRIIKCIFKSGTLTNQARKRVFVSLSLLLKRNFHLNTKYKILCINTIKRSFWFVNFLI